MKILLGIVLLCVYFAFAGAFVAIAWGLMNAIFKSSDEASNVKAVLLFAISYYFVYRLFGSGITSSFLRHVVCAAVSIGVIWLGDKLRPLIFGKGK